LLFFAGLPIVLGALAGCAQDADPARAVALDFLRSPAAANSGQPHLAVAPDGRVVMSWLTTGADGATLRVSTLRREQWSAPTRVATGKRPVGSPLAGQKRGRHVFV